MDKIFRLPMWLVFSLPFLTTFLGWEPAQAQTETTTISVPLELYKEFDISSGRAGVYLPSSDYEGSIMLTRQNPIHTEKLTFTQRWIDIHLYDSKGKEVNMVKGFVFVYFNLNQETRQAWDKNMLNIYHYNPDKQNWVVCKTRLAEDKNPPYGRVRALVRKEFGLYGLAMKREMTVSNNVSYDLFPK